MRLSQLFSAFGSSGVYISIAEQGSPEIPSGLGFLLMATMVVNNRTRERIQVLIFSPEFILPQQALH
jgi:hypothetical protein